MSVDSVPTPDTKRVDPSRPGGQREYTLPPAEYVRAHHTPADFGAEAWTDIPRSTQAFAHRYNVYAGLLPFKFAGYNRLAAFIDIAEWLDSLPPTRESFTVADMGKAVDLHYNRFTSNPGLLTFLLCHDAYPIPTDESPKRYRNPQYVHGHPTRAVLDADVHPIERLLWLHRYASVGHQSLASIADRFGVSASALASFAYEYGMTYSAARQAGRETMARTFHTIRAWTGCPAGELGVAFGYGSASNVRSVLSLHEMDVVPPDPSGMYSFSSSGGLVAYDHGARE